MRGLLLIDGRGPDGAALRLRVEAGRFTDPTPRRGDAELHLAGARVLPGLINAHDHLQLNGLPRLKFSEHYRNAAEWIADLDPRLTTDSVLVSYRLRPRHERLLLGGLKNLLSGATSVLHHDPGGLPADFPVDVPQLGGWSHSLGLDGSAAVHAAKREARRGRPWVIHAAEGLDTGHEFDQLEALGCIDADAVLIHGLALDAAQQLRLAAAGASLVWCPSSNLFLFGRTLDPEPLMARGALLLGSDSRISGERDLLAELAIARRLTGWSVERLERWVTSDAATRLGLTDRGRLAPGLRADLVVLPPGSPLPQRADLRLVMHAGQPLYADPDLAEALPQFQFDAVRLDGRRKALARSLATRLRRSPLHEPGLELRLKEPLT